MGKAERNKRKKQRKRERQLNSRHAESIKPENEEEKIVIDPTKPSPEHLWKISDEQLAKYKAEFAEDVPKSKKKKRDASNPLLKSNPKVKNGKQKKKRRKIEDNKDAHSIVDTALRSASKDGMKKTRDIAKAGEKLFEWLIHPITTKQFFDEYYEKKPLVIQRKNKEYYDGWLSKADIDSLLSEGKLNFNTDIDVTSYKNEVRSTLNKKGNVKADREFVWKNFEKGCSVRLLRPQKYKEAMWRLISCLEAYWKCGGGANSYLTPAGSQGFAPHYDDIEAFVIQLEGKKSWKVYSFYDGADEDVIETFPRLPRYSSRDFKQDELAPLKLVHEIVLEPGDLLYMPRGIVHQARSVEDDYSLHLTLSMGQKNTWADYLMRALPKAISQAADESNGDLSSSMLRKSLPLNYSEYMGAMFSDRETDANRNSFIEKAVRYVTDTLMEQIPFDDVADEMASAFQHDRHDPKVVYREDESEDSDSEVEETVEVVNEDHEVALTDRFHLILKDTARMNIAPDSCIVYHSMKNSRVYHEVDPRGIEFELDDAEALEQILTSEKSMLVSELCCPNNEDKLRIVQILMDEKIVQIGYK